MPKSPPSPHPDTIAAYLAGTHDGPIAEAPLIDWASSMTSAWNVRAVQVLTKDFFSYVRQKELHKLVQLLGPNIGNDEINIGLGKILNIHQAIKDKLDHKRSTLQRQLRKFNNPHAPPAAEVLEALNFKAHQEAVRVRRRERRTLVSYILYISDYFYFNNV